MNMKLAIGIVYSLSSVLLHGIPSGPAQTIGIQFTAATIKDVAGFFRAQPNCTGAVGPTQYVEFTNQNVRSFSKSTGKPDGILDIDSATFLDAPGAADAKLTFDRFGQRWFMTNDNPPVLFANPNTVTMVYSDGPVITPNTKWTVYHFPPELLTPPLVGSSFDSAQLATDANAVYISVDTISGSGNYLGVSSIVIPQSSFIEGNLFEFTVFPYLFNPAEYPDVGGLGFAPSPDNYDPNPEFGYIIVSPSVEVPGYFTYDNYFMLRIINPGSNNPTLYPSSANPISLPAPVYTDVGLVPHKGNLYGAGAFLQNFTGLDFGMPHIRNKQLYFVIPGLVNAAGIGTLPQDGGDRSAILWYQYDLTGDASGQGLGIETESTVPVLIQSGVIFDPTDTPTPLNYWNPALMTDKDGNMAIIGNVAGENEYIQAFYTGRKPTDPLGTLRPITLLTNNAERYLFGTLGATDNNAERWGDYCSLKPDPYNERNLWATSQVVEFQDGWGILTTELLPT